MDIDGYFYNQKLVVEELYEDGQIPYDEYIERIAEIDAEKYQYYNDDD